MTGSTLVIGAKVDRSNGSMDILNLLAFGQRGRVFKGNVRSNGVRAIPTRDRFVGVPHKIAQQG